MEMRSKRNRRAAITLVVTVLAAAIGLGFYDGPGVVWGSPMLTGVLMLITAGFTLINGFRLPAKDGKAARASSVLVGLPLLLGGFVSLLKFSLPAALSTSLAVVAVAGATIAVWALFSNPAPKSV